MAKILVADDNSNIQRMVGLALKDQGIEVVAVGNGEAAVRKISDIRPDLVLADIFMPVRNGYEVCQYVKSDPSLAHIPVILLVGAFDPLDEQEAQRVGADGVLKKPFVPPDPLISMVKSALARAGVSLAGAPAGPALRPLAATDLLKNSKAARHPLGSVTPIPQPSSISLPALDSEPTPEEFSTRPAPVRIDADNGPLAFGNLLDTAATQEAEEDLDFIPTVHPELATERDWRSTDEEETVEEAEEAPKAAWRPDGTDEAFAADETEGKVRNWRETELAETPAGKQHTPAWTPVEEKTASAAAEETEARVSAKITETILSEVGVSAPRTPFSGDAWTAAVSAGSEENTTAANVEEVPAYAAQADPSAILKETPAEVPVLVPSAAEPKETVAAEPSLTNSWFSSSSSPWEAEAQKAGQLASSWDAPTSAAATSSEATPEVAKEVAAQEQAAESATPAILYSNAAVEVADLNGNHAVSAYEAESKTAEEAVHPAAAIEATQERIALPAATVEAIRVEAARVAEASQEAVAGTQTANAAPSTPQPSMDDLVAKVMARMTPEALQAMTREILKPVVEAMVRDELNAKK